MCIRDSDDAIKEMLKVDMPVLFDCRVVSLANCFPMIPSGLSLIHISEPTRPY